MDIYYKRIKKLQDIMAEKNMDVCVLVDRKNLIYFAGIEEIECMAMVIPQRGEPIGITLWLDLEFVKRNSAIENIRPYRFPKQNLGGMINKVVKEMGYKDPVIGFEKYFTSFGLFDNLRNEFNVDKFVNAGEIIYKLRSVKTSKEIRLIKEAAQAVVKAMEAAIEIVEPGVKELDIAAEAEYAAMKAGSQGSPFRPQVVSGSRMLTTHPFASKKEIKNDEMLLVHIGAKCGGYTAKMCRTVAVGNVPQEQIRVYRTLKKAQKKVMDNLKPGINVKELCNIAMEVVQKAGYSKHFLSIIGHGVGLRQSEFYPVITHNDDTVIEKNMVIDILMPTIYKKEIGGPRITDTIHITESNYEKLTNFSNDLVII